jgi:hypothetical protein
VSYLRGCARMEPAAGVSSTHRGFITTRGDLAMTSSAKTLYTFSFRFASEGTRRG